jgi:hypothetical protein
MAAARGDEGMALLTAAVCAARAQCDEDSTSKILLRSAREKNPHPVPSRTMRAAEAVRA